MDLGIAGKVAVIAGATKGMGRATAARLAAEGCAVAVCGRDQAGIDETVAELEAGGARAYGHRCDLTAPGEVEEYVDAAAAALGGLDLLVASAGGQIGGALLDSKQSDWETTFDLNVFYAVRAIRQAVPHMAKGGSVVIISSISGWRPTFPAQYSAAKAAQLALARSLSWDLASKRIRVNAVSPGSTLAPGNYWDRIRAQEPERFAAFEARDFPWGRLGTPEEVADVILFLLSDRARWINGANIQVDGGQGPGKSF